MSGGHKGAKERRTAHTVMPRFLAFLMVVTLLTVGAPERARAATVTVCPVGCDYETPDAAANDPARTPGDVIAVDEGLYFTISPMYLDYDVSIVGAGSGLTIIDATEAEGRAIDISADAITELQGLTVRRGYAAESSGGGISVTQAAATLVDVIVSESTADANGGGIDNDGGLINLVDSVVADNSASASGGGIHTHSGGSTGLTNSTVTNNVAAGGGGGLSVTRADLTLVDTLVQFNASGGPGGGIWNDEGGATITSSLVADNDATGSLGGGIATTGVETSTSVSASTVTGNLAEAGGGVGADGGGTALLFSTISGNDGDDGGGVYHGSGFLSLSRTLVADNLSTAGAVDCSGSPTSLGYNLIGESACSITANTGDQIGTGASPIDALLDVLADNGGPTSTLALLPGSPAIDAADVCEAVDQRGVNRPQGAACDIGAYEADGATIQQMLDATEPGGVVILPAGSYLESDISIGQDKKLVGDGAVTISGGESGPVFVADDGAFTLENLTITDGQAADGGALFVVGGGQAGIVNSVVFSGNHATGSGGAVYVGEATTLEVNDSSFVSNSAAEGGAIANNGGTVSIAESDFTDNGATRGGAISNDGAITIEAPDSSCVTPTEAASFLALTTFSNGTAASEGGAIYNGSGVVDIHRSRFTNNSAEDGGAVFEESGAGLITVGCSVFDLNVATTGGAISGQDDGDVLIDTSLFSANAASASGGAIADALDGLRLVVSNSRFADNTATDDGGAVLSTSDFTDEANHYTGNEAAAGGAVFSDSTSSVGFTSNESVFENNSATSSGGAIHVESTVVGLMAATLTGNTAAVGGGVSSLGNLTIEASTIAANVATGAAGVVAGGGLYSDGTTTVLNTTISGNSAANGSGGGVGTAGGNIHLNQATVVDNHADGGSGGGFSTDPAAALTISNSLVAFNTAQTQADCSANTSLGYNFFRLLGGCAPAPTDIAGVEFPIDPVIGSLADNGGPTHTHALLSGSPAIDAADPGSVGAELDASFSGGFVMSQSNLAANPDGVLTDEFFEAGSFFASTDTGSPFDLTKSFATSFAFVLDPVEGLGANASGDGITFAVVADQGFLGEPGGRLGIGTAAGNPSVAVEFDTYFNATDPSGNHVGINVGGASDSQAVLSLITAEVAEPFDDGLTHWAWVDYHAGTHQIEVYLAATADKPASPTLTASVDIASEVGGAGYFGFTGAGGLAWAHQEIVSWELTQSTCEPLDQRGAIRPDGAACDMGAVEVAASLPTLTDVSHTVDTNSTEPGVIEVPLFDVPIEKITGSGEIVEASPLASIPLASIPLASISIAESPLASIPLASIPLASISIAESPLASIPLASIPLASIGGWTAVLEGTDLAGTPLQTVTLADLSAGDLASITLADISVQGSPLASITLPSIALGSASVSQIDTTQDLCSLPELAPYECQPATTTLLDLEVQGAPLASIPLASIPLASIDLASTPLASIPLASIPLASIPLASIPLASIDVEGAPLASIPLASITPGSTPLASIDLLGAPLASIPLASIPLASIPLASIDIADGSLCDYLTDADPAFSCAGLGLDETTDGIADLIARLAAASPSSTIADSPLASIPLASIDVADAPLASIPLASIDLAGTPLASIPLASIDLGGVAFCDFLGSDATGTAWCTALGIDGSETLLELAVAIETAGSTIADTPLASIPLASIPLASIPLASIDLATTELAGTPLASIPLASIDILGSPLASIPLSSIAGVATCDVITECPTLGDAVALGAVVAGAQLGDLEGAFGPITYGELVEALTLAFILGDGTFGDTTEFGELTFGQLIMSLLLASDYPWEELDLDALGVQEFAADNFVQYSVEFDLDGNGPPLSTKATVSLPGEFLYVEGSAGTRAGGTAPDFIPIGDPEISEEADGSETLTFDLGELVPGREYRLEYLAVPALRLGSFDTAATVEVAGLAPQQADSSTAGVTVIEAASTDADDPAAPAPVAADILSLGTISSVGDTAYFQGPAPPAGYRVAVFLSNLDSDADLVMYRPATAPLPNTRAVPLSGVPVEDDGVDYSFNSTEEGDTLADIGLLAAPLASISTNRGDGSEEASAISDADPLTIQVTGYNGDTSDEPYVLRVKIAPEVPTPQCSPRTFPFGVAPGGPAAVAIDDAALPADLNALYLINWERLAATEGTDTTGELYADTILAELVGSTTDPAIPGLVDRPDLGITGLVLPVEHIADYSAWDANPCDPAAANAVGAQIVDAVASIAALRPTLRYVTIVGSDEVIPFHRKPDLTSIANESTFVDEFSDNALFGSAVTRHFLSDDPYADLDPIRWLDRYLNVPDLAVGRLIEDGSDILGAIRTFNQFDGLLDPQTALTTGYDFLYDGSVAVDDALSAYVPTANALLDDVGLDPALTWGLIELRDALGLDDATPDLPDVAALNMHYDFDEALPSKGDATGDSVNDLFDVTQIAGLDQAGSVYFSAGCHSGLNVADVAVAAGLPSQDWAQTHAENGAIYAAQTGYGYGDTVTVALTEKLMAQFARNLDGTMTIGQAMTFAKQQYFSDLGLYGVYDEKALQEATVYGLPMYRIGSGPSAQPLPPLDTSLDPATGLRVASISMAPAIEQTPTVNGDLFSVDGDTQFVHYRPIQPIARLDVTQPDLLAHGALLTSLTTTDLVDVDIAFGRPIIDLASIEPEVETDEIVFPTTFANVSLYNAPPGADTVGPAEERQQLNVIVGQFTSPADGSTLGTERLFNSFETEVFYADPDDQDFTQPSLTLIQAGLVGNHASFSVTTTDDGKADGVKRVLALYRSSIDAGTGEAEWIGVDLVQSGETWTGGGPVDPSALIDGKLGYMIQAVDASGNVGVSTFKGLFHQAEEIPPPPAGDPSEPGTQVEITGTPGENGWYLDEASIIVTEPAGVTYQYSVNGSPFQPVPTDGFVVTREGVNIVVIRGSDGSEVTFGVLIDTSDPLILIQSPLEGGIVEQGSGATARYECLDAGSGVSECVGSVPAGDPIPDANLGSQTLTVSASDNAGRSSTATHHYTVVSGLVLSGPPDPIPVGEVAQLTTVITDSPGDEVVSWDWESDGIFDESCGTSDTATCTISPSAEDGQLDVTGTHVYEEAGVYSVTVQVEHGGGYVQTAQFEFVVVYDPDGGFVTGGGWFDSPAEAYTPDDGTDLSDDQAGKASFGFVSKYKRGRSAPSGNASFRLETAGFRFRSLEHEWLVISNARARFQGIGLFEDEPPRLYHFRITVLDADVNDSDPFEEDRFRIRIWTEGVDESGALVEYVFYDNGYGRADGLDEGGTTALGGGSIVIHKPNT